MALARIPFIPNVLIIPSTYRLTVAQYRQPQYDQLVSLATPAPVARLAHHNDRKEILDVLNFRRRKPQFAIIFEYGMISVFHRSQGGNWVAFDAIDADDLQVELRMKMLKRKALLLGTGRPLALLILPEEEIVFASQEKPSLWPLRRKAIARRLLEQGKGLDCKQLVIDVVVDDGALHVAAVEKATVRQVIEYSAQLGLEPCRVIALSTASPFAEAVDFGISEGRCRLCRRFGLSARDTASLGIRLPLSRALSEAKS